MIFQQIQYGIYFALITDAREVDIQVKIKEGNMGKELTLKKSLSTVKKSMEQSLVEIFGCVSLDDNETVKRNVVKDRIHITRYFYLDRSPMEETLVEVFGCFALDHKVIKLDVMRDRKRLEREMRIPLAIADSSTEWLQHVHDRLS